MKLNLPEIQYLRGLIIGDQIENDYENNSEIKIAQDKSMFVFTEEILSKLSKQEKDIFTNK